MFTSLPRKITFLILGLTLLVSGCLAAQQSYETHSDLPPNIKPTMSPPRSPQEALNTFKLVSGFEIELVASEPMIEDPVLIDWDKKGRLWVCEMRGFMMDINATDQFAKVGRISVLEDTDGDGKMDKVTRFLDDLVLPRALRCFQEGILVAEHDKLWFVTDPDDDLVPDEKILIDPEYATYGSVEHRPNGLLIGLDNWIYNSRSDKRYKRINGEWKTDTTENRGQWGITQDDYGRLYYNFHWSQLHADIAPPDALTRNPNFQPTLSVNATVSNDQLVYPIRMNNAINRGYRPGVLDDEGKLKRFASACSPWIYRGGSFPLGFKGNAFVCAPAANTIKRNLVIDQGITVSGINAYPDRDFLASTDERFRPVSLSGGPDGALYVVDMYRGIIQQADFMTDFLRRESERRDLEQPINLGRIYRIRPTGDNGEKAPDLSTASPEDLVNLLSHSNGWVRDKAQQQLVWKKPAEAIEPLKMLAKTGKLPTALHALWTLNGMEVDTFDESLALVGHANAKIAAPAMELASKQAESDSAIRKVITALAESYLFSGEHAFHATLALGNLKYNDAKPLLISIATPFTDNAHIREAILSSTAEEEMDLLSSLMNHTEWKEATPGKQLLLQSLANAALRSKDGAAHVQLFQIVKNQGWQQSSIREGLLVALMAKDSPMTFPRDPGLNDDRFLPFLRWPGHNPAAVISAARPLSAEEREQFVDGQAIFSSLCASCHGPDGKGMNLLAPPLAKSDWVTGDPDRLIKILLQGLEGPIEVNGHVYAPPQILPAMPPVAMMSDNEIADTLTFIRRSWGHTADPVRPKDVGRVRDLTTTQETAWTVEELSN
jgi:putative membrane-bound dehydrogenase-like protein